MEIQHISVSPSHRQQGIGKAMVKALRDLYPDRKLVSNENTEPFVDKCTDEEC
ncbi:Uncharacterised protein [Mycobacteroides abscessus subsp. abscessus]|nr:Uncharacterised protein [Mycobacteroides abscessus subsp. abscessus]